MQQIIAHNGRVWERAELHLKSSIPNFSRYNVAKQVELDLLKKQLR